MSVINKAGFTVPAHTTIAYAGFTNVAGWNQTEGYAIPTHYGTQHAHGLLHLLQLLYKLDVAHPGDTFTKNVSV